MFKFLKHHLTRKDKQRLELRALQGVLAVVFGLSLAGGLVLWQTNKDEMRRLELKQDALQEKPQQNVPPHTGSIGGPFTLVDQDGKTVTDAQFRGKYLLVYFGYTYCPDMCPTGLQSIAHALDQLGKSAKKVQALYITIDPARDTPAKLKDYVASFHPSVIGLTGTPAQIQAVAKAYQVYYARAEQVDEHDYVMDHSSLIYLMDPQGKFISTFDEEANPAALVAALKAAWGKKAPAAQ